VGIPRSDGAGRVVDVHALRHTFGTNLAKAGVSLQVAQRAMRHSTPALTANVYTHLGLVDVAGAVDRLPSIGALTRQTAARAASSVTSNVTPASGTPCQSSGVSGKMTPVANFTVTGSGTRVLSNTGGPLQELAMKKLGGPCRTRTCDQVIMSHLL